MSITSVARLQPPIIHRRDAVAAGAQSLRLVCGALLSEVARRSGRTPSTVDNRRHSSTAARPSDVAVSFAARS